MSNSCNTSLPFHPLILVLQMHTRSINNTTACPKRDLHNMLSLKPMEIICYSLQALGVTTTTHNRDVILNSDIIVLAIKPSQVLTIMSEIQSMFSDFQSRAQPHISSPKSWRPLIVSVASSIPIADIEQKVQIILLPVLT